MTQITFLTSFLVDTAKACLLLPLSSENFMLRFNAKKYIQVNLNYYNATFDCFLCQLHYVCDLNFTPMK